MIPLERLKTVTQLWGIDLMTVRHDLHLHGSPERSRFRVAFEDTTGGLFVLEQIAAAHRKRKISIHSILNQLHANGLNQVNPCLRTSSGECLVFCGGDWCGNFAAPSLTSMTQPIWWGVSAWRTHRV